MQLGVVETRLNRNERDEGGAPQEFIQHLCPTFAELRWVGWRTTFTLARNEVSILVIRAVAAAIAAAEAAPAVVDGGEDEERAVVVEVFIRDLWFRLSHVQSLSSRSAAQESAFFTVAVRRVEESRSPHFVTR